MWQNAPMTQDELNAGRRDALIAWCEAQAVKWRDKSTEYSRDNRPASAARATRKDYRYRDLAALLRGEAPPSVRMLDRLQGSYAALIDGGPPSPGLGRGPITGGNNG